MPEHIHPHRLGQEQVNRQPAPRARDGRDPNRLRRAARANHPPQRPARAHTRREQKHRHDCLQPLRHRRSMKCEPPRRKIQNPSRSWCTRRPLLCGKQGCNLKSESLEVQSLRRPKAPSALIALPAHSKMLARWSFAREVSTFHNLKRQRARRISARSWSAAASARDAAFSAGSAGLWRVPQCPNSGQHRDLRVSQRLDEPRRDQQPSPPGPCLAASAFTCPLC